MKHTIEDVAKEAGVSITTVSRAINGNYPVKKETREKIDKAIEKLNFRPNPLARGLITKATNSLGIVVPGITNLFFTQVVHGIEKYVKDFGYGVFISSTEEDAAAERASIVRFMDRFVDGIIVIDPQTENMKNGFIEDATKRIPLICINGFHRGIDANFVLSDEERGSKEAMEHLMNLGHRRIVFIRGESSYSYDIKEMVYKHYMEKKGLQPSILKIPEGNSIDVVDNASRRIIEFFKEGLGHENGVTAFFACNDLMSIGILNACNELNLSVPGDISIVGFDNIAISQMTRPRITTIDQSMGELGEAAAEDVLKLIQGNLYRCDNRIIRTSLLQRESCKKI